MIPEGLIETFLKKVTTIKSYAKLTKHERKDIVAQLEKLEQWLVSDRSLQAHRLFFSFVSFLYSSYGDEYSNMGDYLDELKRQMGYCTTKTTIATIGGERVTLVKYKVKSLAFGKCSRKLFDEVFNRLKSLALKNYGVEFEKWQVEE